LSQEEGQKKQARQDEGVLVRKRKTASFTSEKEKTEEHWAKK